MITEHRKAYKRAHYIKNIEKYKERALARKREKGKLVQSAKNGPCMDCKIKYPYYVMDFDHRENKLFNISSCYALDLKKIEEEIKKCDVVCANCHRIRTYNKIQKKHGVLEKMEL